MKSNTKSHKSIIKSYSKEKNGERDTGAAAWEKEQFADKLQKPPRPNTSEGVFIPAETGQTGSMDRSDRLVRPVRPVPGTGQTGRPAAPPVHDLIRRPRFFLRNEVFSAMSPS